MPTRASRKLGKTRASAVIRRPGAKTPGPRRVRLRTSVAARPARPPRMAPPILAPAPPPRKNRQNRRSRPDNAVDETLPTTIAASSNAASAMQMINPDEAASKGRLTGPPVASQDATTKFATRTQFTLPSVGHGALPTSYGLRVMCPPSPTLAALYAITMAADGSVLGTAAVAPDTYATFPSRFDSIACTGVCVYVQPRANENYVDGSAKCLSVQSIGSGFASVVALTRAQIMSLNGIGPTRCSADYAHRCAFASTDWEADFAFVGPTYAYSATSGCAVIDIASETATTYDVTVVQTWAAVPLADNKADRASLDFIEPSQVALVAAAENQRMPTTDPRRAVVPAEAEKPPPSWGSRVGAGVLGFADGVRGVFDSSKSWVERGSSALDALRSFGSVAGNFLGLFTMRERLARRLYAMSDAELTALWALAAAGPPPTREELAQCLNDCWLARRRSNGRPVPPRLRDAPTGAIDHPGLAAIQGSATAGADAGPCPPARTPFSPPAGGVQLPLGAEISPGLFECPYHAYGCCTVLSPSRMDVHLQENSREHQRLKSHYLLQHGSLPQTLAPEPHSPSAGSGAQARSRSVGSSGYVLLNAARAAEPRG